MRRKEITVTAQADLQHVYDYLAERTPSAAEAYYALAIATFENFPDDFRQPVRVETTLSDDVYVLHLSSPFRGYTLRVYMTDDVMYLLAAFAPGVSDWQKDSRTLRGLREID